MKKHKRKLNVFDIVNMAIMAIFAVIVLVPVLHVLRISLDIGARSSSSLFLIPNRFSIVFYIMILKDKSIIRPFMNSIFITAVGTALSVFLNAMTAYALSKRDLPGNKFLVYYLIILPILFSGGLVPNYLLMKSLKLIDKMAALVLPVLINGWNIAIIINYYWTIPSSFVESARMDGAQEMTVFIKIILPLSKPVLAAIALFTGLGFWNAFFSAIMYINSPEKYTFPVKLREMVIVQYDMKGQFAGVVKAFTGKDLQPTVTQEGLTAAVIIASILPVILVYPYLQKYFTEGLMVNSIKG
ncbi:MAG: carbohydrate ABC transporter permease [Clostridiaceae bacterium]|nr:carbohydrate ABC transporter permease [Clostridiaceae bacterium]